MKVTHTDTKTGKTIARGVLHSQTGGRVVFNPHRDLLGPGCVIIDHAEITLGSDGVIVAGYRRHNICKRMDPPRSQGREWFVNFTYETHTFKLAKRQ